MKLFCVLILYIFVMVYLSKKKHNKKHNKKHRKNTRKYKKKKHIEQFYQLSKQEIKRCNKILVDNEDKCQCFNSKQHPSNDYQSCINKRRNKECSDYNDCKKEFAKFLSGDEPNYDPSNWENPYIQSSHNCYTYFLDDKLDSLKKECHRRCLEKRKKNKNMSCPPKKGARIEKCGELKPQPGDYAVQNGNMNTINNIYTCKQMEKKVFKDNLNNNNNSIISVGKFDDPCPHKKYKGAIVVDPGDNPKKGHTFHFYRQDKNMRYSHKPGVLPIENIDASGKAIYAPHLADRNYNKRNTKNGINYKTFCGYYCIPHNKYAKTNAI